MRPGTPLKPLESLHHCFWLQTESEAEPERCQGVRNIEDAEEARDRPQRALDRDEVAPGCAPGLPESRAPKDDRAAGAPGVHAIVAPLQIRLAPTLHLRSGREADDPLPRAPARQVETVRIVDVDHRDRGSLR